MTRPFLTPKRFAAVAFVALLLVIGFFNVSDLEKIAISLAGILILALAGGTPEAIPLRSEHSTADEEMDG